MGIKSLFGFGQARDKPVRNYSNGEYSFNFGRSTSGKSVNEMTAMQTTAVYACVRILSEAIASLSIHVYRYKDGGKADPFQRTAHGESAEGLRQGSTK